MKSLNMLLGSQEPSKMGISVNSGEQAGSHHTSTKSHHISGTFQAVFPHTYGLFCSRVGRGTRAGGEGAPLHIWDYPALPWQCPVDPTERLNAAFVCAQAICAMHRHGPGSQAAIWDLQAELQEAVRSSPLVLLNSMTIPGLTFSIPAASGTEQPSSRLQQGPTVSISPPGLTEQGQVSAWLW